MKYFMVRKKGKAVFVLCAFALMVIWYNFYYTIESEFVANRVMHYVQFGINERSDNNKTIPTQQTTVVRVPNLQPNKISKKITGHQKEIAFERFRYPLDINFTELILNISKTGTTDIKPINVYPFTYLKTKENICNSTKEIDLLFLIKSAVGNFEKRQAIRETWINRKYFKQDFRHVFSVGRSLNKTIDERLSLEEKMYDDILQMTFVDEYFNNTYKSIGGINWCARYCAKAKFVMMVDDDMYVATDLLLDYLHGLPNNVISSLYAGHVRWAGIPFRKPTRKWHMPVEEYPFKNYPPFTFGAATIMSMKFVQKLHIVIPFTAKFRFDDVFFGILVHKLGVKPIHIPEVEIFENVSNKNKKFKKIIAAHKYGKSNNLREVWTQHLRMMKGNKNA